MARSLLLLANLMLVLVAGSAMAQDVRVYRANEALDPKDVVVESAITMDFEAGSATQASINFRPESAGTYLVRIEARFTAAGDAAAEPFAAIDIVVK